MFHWTVKEVLESNARAFFAILVQARKQHTQRHNLVMRDLCDVMMCSAHIDNYKLNRRHFNEIAFPEQPVRKRRPLAYDSDSDMEMISRVFDTYGHLMG